MTPSGIEATTFRIVAQCLNRVPQWYRVCTPKLERNRLYFGFFFWQEIWRYPETKWHIARAINPDLLRMSSQVSSYLWQATPSNFGFLILSYVRTALTYVF